MLWKPFPLQKELIIDKLYTFHYYELSKSFYTPGESHDFWEMVYVDKGEMEVFTDAGLFHLKQGDVLFYEPNMFHGGQARNAVNLMIVSFEASSPRMSFFGTKSFKLEKDERYMLTELLKEGFEA